MSFSVGSLSRTQQRLVRSLVCIYLPFSTLPFSFPSLSLTVSGTSVQVEAFVYSLTANHSHSSHCGISLISGSSVRLSCQHHLAMFPFDLEMATRQAESDSMTSGDVNGQPLTQVGAGLLALTTISSSRNSSSSLHVCLLLPRKYKLSAFLCSVIITQLCSQQNGTLYSIHEVALRCSQCKQQRQSEHKDTLKQSRWRNGLPFGAVWCWYSACRQSAVTPSLSSELAMRHCPFSTDNCRHLQFAVRQRGNLVTGHRLGEH